MTSRIRGTRSGPTAENAYSSDHKTLVTILHPKRDGTPEGHDVKPTYMMYLEPIEFEDGELLIHLRPFFQAVLIRWHLGNAAEAGLHSHAWPSVNGEIANNIVSYAHEKYPRQVQDRAKTAQGAELGPETGHGTFDKNHEAFPVFAAIAEAAIDVFVSEGRFWMCSHIAFRLFLGGIQWPHAG